MVKNGFTKTLSRHTLFGFATLTRVASALLVVGLSGLTAAESHAQLTVTGGTEVVSQYVWRGYVLVDGTTVQPFLDVDWEDTGLTLSLWGSAAGTQRGDYQNADEFDITLNYAVPTPEYLDLQVGVNLYTYPSQGGFTLAEQTSPEFYVQVAPDLLLSPEVFLAYDTNLGGDFYVSFGVGQGFYVAKQEFSLGATVGYNHGQFEATSGLSHLDVALSTEIALGRVSLSPRAVYVRSLENTENAGNQVFFGVGFDL